MIGVGARYQIARTSRALQARKAGALRMRNLRACQKGMAKQAV